ncbi:MAG: hypothetical protein GC162_01765 [Planctomycetes bacterium]|nr:hypothetical protein [Planctomycetota bacterium]
MRLSHPPRHPSCFPSRLRAFVAHLSFALGYNSPMRRYAPSASLEPRMEMTPLLDVIFLLLTFFIYSLVLTVRAQVVPVKLPSLASGQVAEGTKIAAISVDASGDFFFNRDKLDYEALRARLAEMAKQPNPPTLFLALDARPGSVDRGPALVNLIDTLRSLGLKDFYIVGQPEKKP